MKAHPEKYEEDLKAPMTREEYRTYLRDNCPNGPNAKVKISSYSYEVRLRRQQEEYN